MWMYFMLSLFIYAKSIWNMDVNTSVSAPRTDQQENPSGDNCPKKMIVEINDANQKI